MKDLPFVSGKSVECHPYQLVSSGGQEPERRIELLLVEIVPALPFLKGHWSVVPLIGGDLFIDRIDGVLILLWNKWTDYDPLSPLRVRERSVQDDLHDGKGAGQAVSGLFQRLSSFPVTPSHLDHDLDLSLGKHFGSLMKHPCLDLFEQIGFNPTATVGRKHRQKRAHPSRPTASECCIARELFIGSNDDPGVPFHMDIICLPKGSQTFF